MSRRSDILVGLAQAAARAAERTGFLRLLERSGSGRSQGIHVLTYHRIAEPEDAAELYPGLISATPSDFEQQMMHLERTGRVVSMADVLGAARGEVALPAGAVTLTFDDAYCDFADTAWPTLERLGLPATLFVPTAYPGDPARRFWWDEMYTACATDASTVARIVGTSASDGTFEVFRELRARMKSLPHSEAMDLVATVRDAVSLAPAPAAVLDWDRLRALASAGVSLCPHTRTHPLANRIEAEEFRREVADCIADLQREIGDVLPVFAYPSGASTEQAARVLGEEGIELAFTTARGVARLDHQCPRLLPRIPVVRRVTLPVLRVQLLPQFGLLNGLWARTAA